MPCWAAALCGRLTPAAPQAHMVRPEQSKAFGPLAPHAYGLPSWARAAAIAPAAPLAADCGMARAEGLADRDRATAREALR